MYNRNSINKVSRINLVNIPMIKLNIEQQTDEIRDIENYIRELDPIAVVELQSQQVRRLIYFAKKGVRAYKDYRTKMNPNLGQEITLEEESA